MGMDQRSVRVVVGQGDRARGALSELLADDGFLVVGEAATISDLARVLRDAQPDVIVLDDSIGVAAAQLVTELSPRAKLVVIWPAAVMPIAGAARVDPGEVAMALSATVGLVAGIELSGLGSLERPDWIDKVRKDPSALREKLASSGAAPVRPSVTELQRRGQRLHPSPGAGCRRSTRSARAAAVAAGTLSIASTDATAGNGTAPAGRGVSETDALVSRRIGMIALG
jgi:chemotaxis response regulator CheB